MTYRKRLLFACALIINGFFLSAQPAPPQSVNRTPLPGLVILAAVGVAYGVRKSSIKDKEHK